MHGPDSPPPSRTATGLVVAGALALVTVGAIGLYLASRPQSSAPVERGRVLRKPRVYYRDPAREAPPDTSEHLPPFGQSVYVEELPSALDKVAPEYPEFARSTGVEGTVIVQALVGKDGRVKETRIARSIPGLDEAAELAVRRWTFEPAKAGGKPVAVWVAVPVKFSLH